jgi:hypothetical protein
VPAGWDATADEQRLWTTDAAALEAAGGQLVTADCARYPCLAIVAFGPQPGAAEEGPLAAMRARWPEADVSSRTTLLGGQVVRWYAVVVDPPGSPDVEREVALRQLALAAEGNGPAVEWLETQVQAAPPSP